MPLSSCARRSLLLGGAALASSPLWAQVAGDTKLALVIGNAAYPTAPLLNPGNDAQAMAKTLRSLGFEVLELRNGTLAQMSEIIERLQTGLAGRKGVGLLYYAGHGLQVDGRNFMVPVDARLQSAADIPTQTVDVSAVIEAFKKAATRLNILVLDACRNNPFGQVPAGRGLAPMDAPTGTLLAYATAPGNVASDGARGSANGLYTQHLLTELERPKARIEDIFKRVRYAVRQASKGQQIPWESTSLEDDFFFNEGRVVAAAPPTPVQVREAFKEEAAGWDRIKASTNPDDFYAFLQRYPTGPIAEAAHARLNFLARPPLAVQEAQGRVQNYAADVFRVGDVYEIRASTRRGLLGSTESTLVYRVLHADADRIEVEVDNSGVPAAMRRSVFLFDGAGGQRSAGAMMSFDPPQRLVPGGLLQVGERWHAVVRVGMGGQGGMQAMLTMASRITSRDSLSVPAGRYDTHRIEVTESTTFPGMADVNSRWTYWMAEGLAFPVRSENIVDMPDNKLHLTKELVRFTRGKG